MRRKQSLVTLFASVLALLLLTTGLVACNAFAPATPAADGESAAAGDSDAAGEEEQAADDGPITLDFTLWIPEDSSRMDTFTGIADDFEAEHPNVTVNYKYIPFGDYLTVLPLQLAGSEPPDAGWILENTAPSWKAAGALADIGDTLRSDEDYNFDDFSEPAMELWVEDDSVYGVPFSTSPFLIIYNRDLFEQAGVDTPDVMIENGEWTWENLIAAANTISAETDAYGYQAMNNALYNGDRIWHNILPIVRAYGGEAWSDDGTCLLNSPESVPALELYHSMIFEGEGMVPPGVEADFYSGGAGMLLGQLSRVAPLEEADFGWDVAPLPSGPEGDAQVIGQAAIVAFNESDHKDVAAEFVKFMTTEENVAKLAEFFPPARVSVLESDVLPNANPMVEPESMQAAVVESIKSGRVLTGHQNYPKIDLLARPVFDELWTPDADVQAVADKICETIKPQLQQ